MNKADSEFLTKIEKRLDRLEGREITQADEAQAKQVGPYRVEPEHNTRYLFVAASGCVRSMYWDDYEQAHELFLKNGNCYPLSMRETLETAIKSRQYLFENCDALRPDYSEEFWWSIVSSSDNRFYLQKDADYPELYLFKTREKASNALAHIRQDGAMAILNCGWSL